MKKPRSAKKKNVTNAVIAVVVVTALSAGVAFYMNQQKMSGSASEQWIASGPFAINNSTYRLGDNVFMTITNLNTTDIGKIVFTDPKGGTFTQVPFNGTEKASFNYYFKPNTEVLEKLCTPQDLVGTWTINFQNTTYKPLTFRVLNEWVEGSQKEIQAINPC